jgi:hypothetical protein
MMILLTLPVIVLNGKRSFSKLKMINTMSQEKLSSLGTLSIENDNAENSFFSDWIKDFVSKKALKVNF